MIESGKLLGNRYRIGEKIGEGGMARVFRGVDEKLNRPVAIKILYEQFVADAEFLRRFKQEAKAAAKLSHPAIVNVYDEGEENNIHYIVMELVEGQTLKDLILREGRLSPVEAAKVVYLICDALAGAHAQNIIHRDIKPQNIIITPEGRVKVTDFGIARAVSDATITYGRSLLGSVYYSSPEQARGGQADRQSDIYSLGIVFYEILTGTVPFSGESPVSVALKHLQEDIIPPGKLVPGLSPDLGNILKKAVQKDLSLRYANIAQFRDDLDAWLKDEERRGGQDKTPAGRFHYIGLKRFLNNAEEPKLPAGGDRRRKGIRKAVIAGVLLLTVFVVVFAGYRFLPGLLVVPEVTVPALVGMNLPDADKMLEDSGLGSRVAAEAYSDEVPVNHIVLQDPSPGRSVRQGRVVELTISAGPQHAEIPNLVGKTEREASLLLNDLGLEMEISYDYSELVTTGVILRHDPGEGFRLGRGETVKVVISGGGRPFTMRDFRDWTLHEMQAWLTLYGLILRNVREEYSNEIAQGRVISHAPPAGETIHAGALVDLVISRGSAAAAVPVHTVEMIPAVPLGKVIRVVVLDRAGQRIIFEGAYGGQVFTVQGAGSGRIVIMEQRADGFHTFDYREFP